MIKIKSTYSLALMAVAGTILTAATPLHATVTDDAAISAEIFQVLLANNTLAPGSDGQGATFTVTNGIVTIAGNIPTRGNKEQTDSLIAKLPGVERVADYRMPFDLATNQTPAESAAKDQKIDDTSLTEEINSSLVFHNSTKDTLITVATTNGVVTIGGIARSETEKNRITQLATDIKGVNSVINNMTIAVPVALK